MCENARFYHLPARLDSDVGVVNWRLTRYSVTIARVTVGITSGDKPPLGAFLLYLCLAYPLFSLVHASPSFARLLITQIMLCSLQGAVVARCQRCLQSSFRLIFGQPASALSPTWAP
jgi:hypothetical protein